MVALAAVLAKIDDKPDFSRTALTQSTGFAGVDGLFRFLPDGRSDTVAETTTLPEFPQGEIATTPLQMAIVASTIANGGVAMEPHVAARIDDRSRDLRGILRAGGYRDGVA